jgi:hypothetical protein
MIRMALAMPTMSPATLINVNPFERAMVRQATRKKFRSMEVGFPFYETGGK